MPFHKRLPLNLEPSLAHLKQLDGTLRSKFDRIQLKNLHHVGGRSKQAHRDPRIADLHRKIDHQHASSPYGKKRKSQQSQGSLDSTGYGKAKMAPTALGGRHQDL